MSGDVSGNSSGLQESLVYGVNLAVSIRINALRSSTGLLRTSIRSDEVQILIQLEVIYHRVNLYMSRVAYKHCSGADVLTRPQGSIGETKLKILAIIHNNAAHHGYGIWMTLKKRFYLYLDEQSRRNVYHHLCDLNDLGLVERASKHMNEDSSIIHSYILTNKGIKLESKFRKYMTLL